MRDRGDLHRHVIVFKRDVAVALAERPFGLKEFGVDQAFDHEFSVRRHVEIDRGAFDGADWRAGKRARDRHLIAVGTGKALRPPPGLRSASPLMTTSWHSAAVAGVGAIGLAMARNHASPISSNGRPMPTA